MLPISVNAIYQVNYRQRRFYLHPQALLWKTKAKMFVPLKPTWMKGEVKFEILWVLFNDFYFKNGKIRKYDLANFEKILIDAICEKWGHDDTYAWKRKCKKSQVKGWTGVGICVREM